MMEEMGPLQMILLGALLLVVLFWFGRGIGNVFQESREAESDWTGLLLPIGGVVLFVLVLMMLVSR